MKQQAVRLGAWLLLAALLVLSGCRSFAPASPATQQLVRAMELSERIPADQFLLEIESPFLAGVFDVLFVVEQQVMRAQLFPDVGGKVMDLTVGVDAITATMPAPARAAVSNSLKWKPAVPSPINAITVAPGRASFAAMA